MVQDPNDPVDGVLRHRASIIQRWGDTQAAILLLDRGGWIAEIGDQKDPESPTDQELLLDCLIACDWTVCRFSRPNTRPMP